MAGVALKALSGALGLGLVARDARDAAAFCVAGVAQSHIHLRFAWQAWRNLTRNFVTHIHIHIHIHTYVRTYVHTYVHAYYLFTYFHIQSFTTSFVFPSFPVPATTFEAQYWKKLTCGVIRSLTFLIVAMVAVVPPPQLLDVVWCSAVVVVVVV